MGDALFAEDSKDIRYAEYAIAATAIASGIGIGMWVNPIAASAALVGSLALGTGIWRARGERERDLREQQALRTWSIYADEIPDMTADKRLYFGQGFPLTAEWRRSWDQIVGDSPAVRPDDDAPTEGGDPRHYGIGYRAIQSMMVLDRTMSVHMGVFGSPGSGKTRFVESLLAAIIQYDKNSSVVMVDPKGDEALRNTIYSLATRAGRPFDWVTLANPSVSKSYNAFARYKDPTELSAKIKMLVPQSGADNAYFTQNAEAAAMRVAMIAHTIKTFLLAIGGADNRIAPLYVVAGRATAAARKAGRERPNADDIRAAWALSPEPSPILNTSPQYALTPHGWIVRLSMLYPMGVLSPRVPIAHIAKILWPIAWAGRDPNRVEDEESDAKAKAEGSGKPWQQPNLYTEVLAPHPLDQGYSPKTADDEAAVALWEPLVRSEYIGNIRALLDELRGKRTKEFQDDSRTTLEERTKGASSLRTGVDSFMGRDSIIDAPISDVDLGETVRKRGIVYLEMDILRSSMQAEALGKMLIADMSALAGAINATDIPPEDRSPIYLIVDELNSFATKALAILMSQSRSANIRVIYLAQDRSGLSEKVGQDVMKQFLNNTGTLVQLRVRDRDEADAAAKFARQVQILKAGKNIGITPGIGDSGHKDINLYSANEGHTWSEEKADLIPTDMLLTLPFGHAVVVSDGHPMLLVAPQVKIRDEHRRELLTDLGISHKAPPVAADPVEGL